MLLKSKNNVLLPLLLALITILTRIPFTSKLLYHMDSVQFALALKKYDITVHQPHPPGYFLYVMLGKFFNLLTGDANMSFIAMSIIASGLTVFFIFLLTREIYDIKTAFWSSILANTSPLLWFHSEVALTYILEASFSVSFAFLCWKILNGQYRLIFISALLLAFIGGVRQSTLVFLIPLWLYSIRKSPYKYIIISFALLVTGILSWFLPMLSMSGGYAQYKAAVDELWAFTVEPFTVLNAGLKSLFVYSKNIFQCIIYGLGLSAAFVVFYLFKKGFKHTVKLLLSEKGIFIVFWIVPVILFYLFIHTGPSGYSLIFMPGLLMLSVKAIDILTEQDLKKFVFVIVLTSIFNVYLFFFLKTPVSFHEFMEQRSYITAFAKQVRKNFLPSDIVIFSDVNQYYSARHFMYYLPEYRVYMVYEGVDTRGRRRRVLWGQNMNTFISPAVYVPKGTKYFVNPIGDTRILMRLKESGINRLSEGDREIAFYGDIRLAPKAYSGIKFVIGNN
jgi:hypothetical protein